VRTYSVHKRFSIESSIDQQSDRAPLDHGNCVTSKMP
jgi:hypothetical protein